MTNTPDPTPVLQALIRCPSVTPLEAGVLDYMEGLMVPAGFTASRMPFSEDGTADVDNLFLRIGSNGPHFALQATWMWCRREPMNSGRIRLLQPTFMMVSSTAAVPVT